MVTPIDFTRELIKHETAYQHQVWLKRPFPTLEERAVGCFAWKMLGKLGRRADDVKILWPQMERYDVSRS